MSRPVLVWLAGGRWDAQEGTEVRLVQALVRYVDVVWCDPAASCLSRHSRSGTGAAEEVAPGIVRVVTRGFPGVTRRGLGAVAQRQLWANLRRVLEARGARTGAVVLADPTGGFPPGLEWPGLLHVTDDWLAGSELMGVAAGHLANVERRNAARASVVATVSPELSRRIAARTGREVVVIPNGCDPEIGAGHPAAGRVPSRIAGVVGTLNERIDLRLLEAVADRGVELLLVGPVTARSGEFVSRLGRLLARPGVEHRGARPASEIPGILGTIAVGLTPYADTSFNRASFPLKTLEYLAAGLPVVSTSLPANEVLDTDLVEQAGTPRQFAELVVAAVSGEPDAARREQRVQLAQRHSWDSRARQLLELLELTLATSPPDHQPFRPVGEVR